MKQSTAEKREAVQAIEMHKATVPTMQDYVEGKLDGKKVFLAALTINGQVIERVEITGHAWQGGEMIAVATTEYAVGPQTELIVEEEDGENEVVSPECWTRGQLRTAFERIENHENWKKELRGWIPEAELMRTRAAAQFFAGSPLEVMQIDNKKQTVLVDGAGYYVCIGA